MVLHKFDLRHSNITRLFRRQLDLCRLRVLEWADLVAKMINGRLRVIGSIYLKLLEFFISEHDTTMLLA